MTINVYMLQHLKIGVQNFGPLWTHSAFEFESLNDVIKNAVSGKAQVAHKVMINCYASTETYMYNTWNCSRSSDIGLITSVIGILLEACQICLWGRLQLRELAKEGLGMVQVVCT